MKKIILPIVMIIAAASAQGHRCSALCVSSGHEMFDLYNLGKVELELGGDMTGAYAGLENLCERRSAEYGLWGSSFLVESLVRLKSESYWVRSFESYTSKRSHYFTQSYWHSFLYEELALSRAEDACVLDESIPSDFFPYMGQKRVL